MIPTLIVFGLAFGRWWRTTLVVGVLGWPVALVATDVMDVGWALVPALALALINTGVGVLVHQGARALPRRLRHRRTSTRNA